MTNTVNNAKTIQNLVVEELALTGVHLIEASAGTGKTFNITRMYIRLLLERQLDVKQILVMTFTKAATEELRGRIRGELARAVANWGILGESESFYRAMESRFDKTQALPILNLALLHMDEASIFTIHGFCANVLSQYAFQCQIDLSMTMEADTHDIEHQAVSDFYRTSAKLRPEQYQAMTDKWPTPLHFHQSFQNEITTNTDIFCLEQQPLIDAYYQQKSDALAELKTNRDSLYTVIIEGKKDWEKRETELNALFDWLANESLDLMPKLAKDFLNGNRYKKVENKALVAVTIALKDSHSDQIKAINDNIAFTIATQAIGEIREQITQQKAYNKLMGFDDLIQHLFNSLYPATADKQTSQLAQQLANDYPVALVDEFQDTDPYQYGILSAIYLNRQDTGLFMIGDPKQAIYGFRGGDINAYLAARDQANQQWLLDTNWRSTPAMITAYNRLFYGQELLAKECEYSSDRLNDKVFEQGIQYHPVKAGKVETQNQLNDPVTSGALVFNLFKPDQSFVAKQGHTLATFRPIMAEHCASEINRLLAGNTKINGNAVTESDIAILVRTGGEAQEIQTALAAQNIVSVYQSAKENVFESLQAQELLLLLNGVIHNHDLRAITAAMATQLLGYSPQNIYRLQHDEVLFEQIRLYFTELYQLWQQRSFMAMALKVVHERYHPRAQQHERQLTNTMHLLELLQQASNKHQTPMQLVQYLQREITQPNKGQEYELRLESDEQLVKIITQHGSKGLEYPIVFVPFASRYSDPAKIGVSTRDSHSFYHQQSQQKRTFIGHQQEILDLARHEQHLESIRLLYVAVTRAEYRCYLGVAPFENAHLSPLGCCLNMPEGGDWQTKLTELAKHQPNEITCNLIEEVASALNPLNLDVDAEQEKLSPALFNGNIERNWWLSSFSALTRNLRHGGGVSLPEHHDDEKASFAKIEKEQLQIRFALKKGAETGNFLHSIFETIDFKEPDYESVLPWLVEKYGGLPEGYSLDDLKDWCDDILNTPLPQLCSGPAPQLGQLSAFNVVKEAEFYFPMKDTQLTNLARVLSQYRQSGDGVSLITLPGRQTMQGMLHGFIDLIFEWQGKFYVADYKSTHLGNNYEDYHQAALKKNLEKSYYDLQYLLYSLALHRYLKSRMPDYEFSKHFGGVYYLYLRGIKHATDNTPDNTSKHYGIYATPLAEEVVIQLDNLFCGKPITLDSFVSSDNKNVDSSQSLEGA